MVILKLNNDRTEDVQHISDKERITIQNIKSVLYEFYPIKSLVIRKSDGSKNQYNWTFKDNTNSGYKIVENI